MSQTAVKLRKALFPMDPLFIKYWFANATKERRQALATAANTSVNMLWQFANKAKNASAKKAAEIEKAAAKLGEPLLRGDVCSTCAECPFYRKHVDKCDPFNGAP